MSSVRAAIIGVGAWGRVLNTAANRSKKIQFVCCVGRNRERLDAFARDVALPVRDMDDVLDDKTIDAVVLALPNELHCSFAERAAKAGKHIYIEKPIANTMADALKIERLEREYNVRIAIGHCARLLAGNRIIRRAIDAGELGEVTQIETNFSNDRALRLTPKDWRWRSASAPGGSLSQLAIHLFDTLRFLGGDIEAVYASAGRHSPVGAEVEDQWIVTVCFADGKLGTAISSWTSPGAFNVHVTGMDGVMDYDIDQTHWGAPERLHENATLYFQPRGGGPGARRPIAVPQGDMFRDELDIFADYAENGESCELSASNGASALAAVHAALKSASNDGQKINLAEFLGDKS